MQPQELDTDRLLEGYDAFLLDAYGVLMHEGGPLPGACAFIDRLNRDRVPHFILTNDAAKLPVTTAKRLQRMGFAIDAEAIITSGALLVNYFREHALSGKRTLVLGPMDSHRYAELAGGVLAGADEAFDVLVIGDESGYPFLETMDTVLTALYRRLDVKAQLHLVVPNPDIVYPAGENAYGFAAGSVAAMFEGALRLRYPERRDLRFARLGKPNRAIFDEGLRRIGNARRVAMIGDTLDTDIRGANDAGIDSILIGTGVSLPDWSSLSNEVRPTGWLSSFET